MRHPALQFGPKPLRRLAPHRFGIGFDCGQGRVQKAARLARSLMVIFDPMGIFDQMPGNVSTPLKTIRYRPVTGPVMGPVMLSVT